MTDPVVLQSFVPVQLRNWLVEQGSPPAEAVSEPQEMVVWFADLSNFSHLTYEITERERAGPEFVTDLLNQAFGQIIDTIVGYGGEVLDFAGDSVVATWPSQEEGGLARSLQLATSSAMEAAHLTLPDMEPDHSPLGLRIGIGAGVGQLMQVGGSGGHWHFLIGGSPFDQIGIASRLARPGDVVLSPQAVSAMEDTPRGDLVEERGFLRLAGADAIEPPGPGPQPDLTVDLAKGIKRFLSPPVVDRLDAGHTDWLGEFRRVTSLFLNLPALDLSEPTDRDTLQHVAKAAQHTLAVYEGTLARIMDDDKGVTIMAAFGLPPLAHEEDPYRAVQASSEIQATLTQMRLDFGMGIATGRAFCGAYGSPVRRDYTTIGREVNLAARLMQVARFETLCDQATARAARRIEFHPLGERTLRGWDSPVPVFRPLWEKVGAAVPPSESDRLVGRESEQNQLVAWLGALDRAHSSAVVVVEGEAGIGKSALASVLLRTARSFDVKSLNGAALPVAQAPFQAWRGVIQQAMGLSTIHSPEERQQVVLQRISEWPEFSDWEPLLNSVLDLQFPETAATRGMSGRGGNRRDATVELLVRILSDAAAESPLLIVLDDLHLFDSASWAVAVGVARKISPLLMVLFTRPMAQPPDEMEELTSLGTSARLVLEPMSQRAALELARERLGARELDTQLADLITQGAEGIPFFIEELVFSLRDSDALDVNEGLVSLVPSVDDPGVPHTLSSVVLSRIDHLSPQLQLTLKVASVIGRSFDIEEMRAVHPSHPGADELAEELSELADLGLIVESSPGSFDFKHALIRDAAYDLLLFDQRRRIHRSVATFFEDQAGGIEEPLYALLAYHWEKGDDHRKALGYFEKSGANSLRKGANREALEAHSKSLELLRSHGEEFDDVTPLRESQWHVEIGQAHEGLGEFDQAEESFLRALELVGARTSTSPLARLGRLLREAVVQMIHVFAPASISAPGNEDERARLGQAAHVAALLGEIYYFKGDLLGFPLLCLMAINLGERAGEPLVAGLAYANFGYLVGTLRLRRLAERYFSRARRAERLESELGSSLSPTRIELEEMGPGHLIAVAIAEGALALTFDEWDRARTIVTEGLQRCNRFGDKYSAGIALAVRGFGSYSSGYLEDALSDYELLLASARARSNAEHEGWARSFVTPVLLAFDRVEAAQQMADAAVAILDSVDPVTVPIIHGSRSQVQMRMGRYDEARSSAELALRSIDSTPIFIYLAGFSGMLDTFLELWAAEGGSSSRASKELSRLAAQALRKMRTFSLVLPFARPKYRLFLGRYQRLMGRTGRARRNLRTGLELARRNGFTWDEGLIHLELGLTFPEASEEREAHLTEARRLFEEVGSLHDLGVAVAAGDSAVDGEV